MQIDIWVYWSVGHVADLQPMSCEVSYLRNTAKFMNNFHGHMPLVVFKVRDHTPYLINFYTTVV